MQNIRIIAVGKIKEKYLVSAVEEYSKRLSRYCKLEIIEVSDQRIPDNCSMKEEELAKKKECEQILHYLKENDYIIALCIEGKQMDSVEFANTIYHLGVRGQSNIAFIIGGSVGLSDEIKALADLKLSFSKMTFPHQLMRVILLEQIYRCFKINANEIYHK